MIVYLVKYRNLYTFYDLFDIYDNILPSFQWSKIISVTMVKVNSNEYFECIEEKELKEYL